MNSTFFCPNDDFKNPYLSCIYWKYSIPQKSCYIQSLKRHEHVSCLVLDGDSWFTQLFEPLKK